MSEKCPTVKVTATHASQGAFVEINESDFDAARHVRYIEPPPAPLAPPPLAPPPAPPDPLNTLPADWRDWEPKRLREFAASVSGRAVENKAQAIQVISQAIVQRGK